MANITSQDQYIDGSSLLSEVNEIRDDIENYNYAIEEKTADMNGLDALDDEKAIEELEREIEDIAVDIAVCEEEVLPLAEFLEQIESSGMNMMDVSLVHDDSFEEYIQERAIDCGDISRDSSLITYVDWERYAKDASIDFVSVTFEGEEYHFRG